MDLTAYTNECPVCGTKFLKQRYHPKTYCSEACGKKAYKEQHPEDGGAVRRWQEEHKDQMTDKRLRRVYKITKAQYDDLFTKQNGLCLICGRPDDGSGHKLSVDHDHRDGHIRGLLCHKCNNSLGCLNDSPALFRKAAEYLEHYASS